MRVFLTGGTGLLGAHVARKLRQRGDEVAALARSPERARDLEALGCDMVQGDLAHTDAIKRGLEGCDAAIHGAAMFKIGAPESEHAAMWDANVHGTERVFDAAAEAGLKRVVYVSTVMVFGNTRGRVHDDSYTRPPGEPFMSYYEETKHRAHEVALDRIAGGAPIVIVQPGGIYGPGDESDLAGMIEQAGAGKLKMKVFPDTGGTFVYVEDAADGTLLALDRGESGESYILGGEMSTFGEVLDKAALLSGHKPTRRTMPPAVVKAIAPLAPAIGSLLGLPPNLRETIAATHDTTFWFRDDKARDRLGYSPRDLDAGLRATLASG